MCEPETVRNATKVWPPESNQGPSDSCKPSALGIPDSCRDTLLLEPRLRGSPLPKGHPLSYAQKFEVQQHRHGWRRLLYWVFRKVSQQEMVCTPSGRRLEKILFKLVHSAKLASRNAGAPTPSLDPAPRYSMNSGIPPSEPNMLNGRSLKEAPRCPAEGHGCGGRSTAKVPLLLPNASSNVSSSPPKLSHASSAQNIMKWIHV